MDLSALSTDDLKALRDGDLSKVSTDGLKAMQAAHANDPSYLSGIGRAFATGVPVVGGLLNKADAATNAALSYAVNPIYQTELTGSFGDRYRKSLSEQEGADQSFAESHPIANTAANIAGGVAATAPLMAAAPGLMGASGGVLRQAGMGGLSNAVIGGADAATRGGDIPEGALLGGVFGLAAPFATAAGSKVLGQAANLISPELAGRAHVGRFISESGLTPAEIEQRVQQAANEGQGVYTVGDAMGTAGQRGLSTAARGSGAGRTAVYDALNQRQLDQADRVASQISNGFGSHLTPDQMRDAMTAERGAIADQNYGAVRDNAAPVDVQNVIDHIDANVPTEPAAPDSISGRLQRYRRMLTDGAEENPQNLSDFEQLQRVRSELSDEAETARRAGQGNRARMLGDALRKLDTSLENASEGFRQANREFSQASRNIDAIDQGTAAAGPRARVEDTIPLFQGLSPRGQQAFRTGYADPLIAKAQGGAEGVNAARPLTSSKFQRVADAVAPNNDLMQRQIARENEMFATRNTALGGSKTADNLADAADLSHLPVVVGHALAHNPVGVITGLANMGKNIWSGSNSARVREVIARYLLLHGGNLQPGQLQALVDNTYSRLQTLHRLSTAAVRSGATTNNAQQQRSPIFTTH